MYRIIGGDGQEYGPSDANEIRQWIADGRLSAQSKIRAENSTQWMDLGDMPEFAGTPSAPTTPSGRFTGSPSRLPAGGGRDEALRRVKGPALALAINGVLALLMAILDLVVRVLVAQGRIRVEDFLPAAPGMEQLQQQLTEGLGQPFGIALSATAIVVNGLVIFGALKMRNLQSFGLAIGISVLSMLPCQCCCVLGLPFGIWALTVLNKPEVRPHFD